MAQQREIQYSNKSFTDLRQQLIDYTRNYFPDTYNDFSPTSPGMMFMEMAAYVGDILSFYQDVQLQETYLQYAQEPANLYTLAYLMGYRPKVTTASSTMLTLQQEVPAKTVNGQKVPNYEQYGLVIDANAVFQANSTGQPQFISQEAVDFSFSSSYSPMEITVATYDNSGPLTFLLKKQVPVISATIETVDISIEGYERFKTISISSNNILGILDITDSGADTWTEVPYLAQDTVLVDTANVGTDKSNVPYLMQLQKVPKRFVTRFTSTGNLQVQFGAGQEGVDDSIITPDPTNVGLGIQSVGVSAIDKAYDPSNFMYTGAYGIAPVNTTLTIRYLTGGGVPANVPANTITTIISSTKSVKDPAAPSAGTYEVFTVNNLEPATGGKDGDTVEELRQNSLRAYSEQLRAVTREDYTVRALSMPSKFGAVSKAYVTQDQLTSTQSTTDTIIDSNPLSLSMYILAYNNDNTLTTAAPSLKTNLQTYLNQYKLITDRLNIKDAFIVNIGVKYEIIIRPSATGRDVLIGCTQALKEYFDIKKRGINQSINLSKLYTLLDKVPGVQTVQKIEIVNKVGGSYSEYGYDIKGATRNNIVYPSYDPCIFEVKYPNSDIEGRITTL